jgi:hypothetical protein
MYFVGTKAIEMVGTLMEWENDAIYYRRACVLEMLM